jgi:hypothetical protein
VYLIPKAKERCHQPNSFCRAKKTAEQRASPEWEKAIANQTPAKGLISKRHRTCRRDLFPLCALGTFVKDQLTKIVSAWVYFWALYPVSLISVCFHDSSYRLGYYSFVVYFQFRLCGPMRVRARTHTHTHTHTHSGIL